ncbi:MAG: hypothetical protein AB7O92_25600 [Acidimicrobiia bacterium]
MVTLGRRWSDARATRRRLLWWMTGSGVAAAIASISGSAARLAAFGLALVALLGGALERRRRLLVGRHDVEVIGYLRTQRIPRAQVVGVLAAHRRHGSPRAALLLRSGRRVRLGGLTGRDGLVALAARLGVDAPPAPRQTRLRRPFPRVDHNALPRRR